MTTCPICPYRPSVPSLLHAYLWLDWNRMRTSRFFPMPKQPRKIQRFLFLTCSLFCRFLWLDWNRMRTSMPKQPRKIQRFSNLFLVLSLSLWPRKYAKYSVSVSWLVVWRRNENITSNKLEQSIVSLRKFLFVQIDHETSTQSRARKSRGHKVSVQVKSRLPRFTVWCAPIIVTSCMWSNR
jgi:hypothetical protein